MQTENLGFCAPGDGGLFAESGATEVGGSIPVNPSGGLEAKGHPIGATGLGQVFELVSQLRGVNYHWNEVGLQFLTRDIEKDWKSDSGKPEDNQALWQKKRAEACEKLSKTQTGFIAQEVERVFPDWVKTDEQGFKKINMEHLNAVLVNAINEQQTEIENQQTQIQTLKTQQTELEKNLSAKDAELQALHAKVAEVDQWKQRLEAIEKLLAPAK